MSTQEQNMSSELMTVRQARKCISGGRQERHSDDDPGHGAGTRGEKGALFGYLTGAAGASRRERRSRCRGRTWEEVRSGDAPGGPPSRSRVIRRRRKRRQVEGYRKRQVRDRLSPGWCCQGRQVRM